MTDDIVTRLRHKYAGQLPICAEAADEIERLRAEVAALRAPIITRMIAVSEDAGMYEVTATDE